MTQGPEAFAGLHAETFLHMLPDPLLHVRRSGEATLNPAAQERLGTPPTPRDWPALFLPETAQVLQSAVTRAAQGDITRNSVRVADTVAPALLTVTPDGQGGALIHLRKAREPLEVALELMDGLNLGMTVQGADTRILHANQAAQDILGLSLEQLTGRATADPRWRAISADGQPFPLQDRPSNRALQDGQPHRDVTLGVYHPPSGEWRWLNSSALPRRAPGAAHAEQVTTVFQDVTERHHLQQELHRREQRFRSLVEAAAQIVWDAWPDGTFMPPQTGWEAFTGQTPAEYQGAGWLMAVHPDDRESTKRAWQAAVDHLQPYATEHRLRRADGVFVPMQVRGVPVLNPDGAVREWIGTHTDISAVRAAEEHLRTLNATLEQRVQERTQELADITRFSTLLLSAAGEGIFGLDPAGRTTFANPAAARILGYGIERLIGQEQHAMIHHHHEDGRVYPVDTCPIHLTIRDGQTRRVEQDVFWHARGHAVPVAYVVTATRDEQDRVQGVVVMFQDITERRRAQQALEDVVRDLERSNQELEQFAYVASHDLQEPLRTIGSYTELLARRYQGQLDGRADQYLHFMQDAVTRMRSLIQDLLNFSRLGRNEMQPAQPVALERLLHLAAQDVAHTLQETGGTLSWDAPYVVLGVPAMLSQLFTNLISNALKFRRMDAPPRVTVRSVQRGDMVEVTVQDNGIGIAPEYQERVFTIFQRLHHRDVFPGNGIGLAICRKIAEHHGGQLWLTSVPGEGSTFHFTLPVAPPDPA